MTSRVIHLRVKDTTLVGCYHFLKGNGYPVEGRPLSTITTVTLDSLVEALQAQGEIQRDVTVNATEFLNKIYAPTTPGMGIDVDALKTAVTATVEETDPGEARETLREQIQSGISNIVEPSLEVDGDIFKESPQEEEGPKIDLSRPPWRDIDRWEWVTLAELAPKDRFIEAGIAAEDPTWQLALCVAYRFISRENWGSESAKTVVEGIYLNYTPYLSVNPYHRTEEDPPIEKT